MCLHCLFSILLFILIYFFVKNAYFFVDCINIESCLGKNDGLFCKMIS